ncbi:hypothetical protein NNJEOMEG_03493 [Fundidesulfovibrio magnetotacticus]|uniref:DUF945 domain-containing protein n=1 Tax=Fundidesulfovibrio magnetotacticus TaxID=2730080 RepID=A0A6V8M535_9BACT|nr:DUF945 family protein [Fundidesulfovibrio magnetotacticus]GFK95625.1 hypothetical protein NNJEOMEG_03493 [Fundidesulfovibrio magnetotacticus]
MRTLLAILAAALLILLGSFLYLGAQAREAVQQYLSPAASGATGAAMSLKERSSGLFSSRLVFRQEMVLSEDSGKHEEAPHVVFDVVCDIAHGPLPLAAGSFSPSLALVAVSFAVDPASDASVRDFFQRLPELAATRATIRYAFDRKSVMDLTVPPLERTLPDDKGGQVTVRFQGLTATAVANAAMEAVEGTLASPGLSLRDKDAGTDLDGLSLTFDSKMSRPGFWTGTYVLKAGSLRTVQSGGQALHLRDARADMGLLLKGDALDYLFALAATVAPENGQPVPLRASLETRNLDAAAMERLTALLRESQVPGRGAPDEAQMRAVGEALLKGRPQLDLDLNLLDGNALQALHAEVRVEELSEMPQHLAGLLPFLRAKAAFSGREADLLGLLCAIKALGHGLPPEQCGQVLSMTVENQVALGRLRREGDRLLADALWDGDRFTLNGATPR